MKFKNIYGREVSKSITPYLVKWDHQRGSVPQLNVKKFFEPYWSGHVVCEEFLVPGSRLRCDLLNFTRKIAVETHGRQHEQFVKHFHKTRSGFTRAFTRDLIKYKWLEANGFQVIEIFDYEIKDLSEEWVLKKFDIEL